MTFLISLIVFCFYLHVQIKVNALFAAEASKVLDTAPMPIASFTPDTELSTLTIRQLKSLASEANVKGYGNLTKPALITVLKQQETHHV